MAEDSGQEKTEEPTSRRLQQAREKGQVPRSKEMGTAAVLLASALGFIMTGPAIAQGLANVMAKMFTRNRAEVFDSNAMFNVWKVIASELTWPVAGFIVTLTVIAVIGNILLGGFNFSTQAMMPKASKMSPVAGFKRMFGVQSLVELAKGIAKFAVVVVMVYILLSFYFIDILQLSRGHLPGNMRDAMELLAWMFLLLCSSLVIIAIFDVPFQVWNHTKQLRMSLQDIKDEYKDTEGKPEVKGRIRQLQREASQRRMMAKVPEADVIMVNPEHYAVALKYDVKQAAVPFVVAKGSDEVAFKIREIARAYEIPIVSAPPLTRAIYYSTKLDQQIPNGLFTAVAQVLAYIYQLKQFQQGKGRRPTPLPTNQPIPDELKR
ncbi:flagellar biosynthesis protein FlhB [Shewanella sp. NIFS-20-20]|uniref:flagellar biosynthesis protein FlhB n=1 Tax=Shewanella sp. NIFS-20-20 TaxID=2853806 RepID=UPI001C453CE5|nr:flagellar biosynthesis protein FlhB [Shewanella sp. NIFS-20-20]